MRRCVAALIGVAAFWAPALASQVALPPGTGTDLSDVFLGGDGDDIYRGRDGEDRILGRNGDDRLYGQRGGDTLFGGSGRDRLVGGLGDDTLTGGAGNDLVRAGAGNDRIDVRDGRQDSVACGAGRDAVVADVKDRAALDCEAVRRLTRHTSGGATKSPSPGRATTG